MRAEPYTMRHNKDRDRERVRPARGAVGPGDERAANAATSPAARSKGLDPPSTAGVSLAAPWFGSIEGRLGGSHGPHIRRGASPARQRARPRCGESTVDKPMAIQVEPRAALLLVLDRRLRHPDRRPLARRRLGDDARDGRPARAPPAAEYRSVAFAAPPRSGCRRRSPRMSSCRAASRSARSFGPR